MAQRNSYVHLTETGTVIAGEGVVSGMYVSNTSSGTLVLYDYTSETGDTLKITGTITPVIGYHDLGDMKVNTGCYACFGGSSLDITFFVKESD